MSRRASVSFAIVAVSAIAGALALLRGHARLPFLRVAVAGESMSPALLPDEFLVLRAGAPSRGSEYGRIVAVRDPRPEAEGRLLLKRIVGLPGEALRVGGGVQVNGRVLEEPYAHGETPFEQHRGINRLEPDQYFVLGDHRGASTDSRDFGPVAREAILGTASFRYWPPERIGRLRAPERILLGAADAPGGKRTSSPAPSPLPFLGRRVEVAPPPQEPSED